MSMAKKCVATLLSIFAPASNRWRKRSKCDASNGRLLRESLLIKIKSFESLETSS